MTPSDELTPLIYLAATQEEILAIQKFRYSVYADEMNLEVPGIDHAEHTMGDPLDSSGLHIYATLHGAIAGVVRLNPGQAPAGLEIPLEIGRLPKPFCYCSRFCIQKRYRGTAVSKALVKASFAEFRDNNAAVAICHCYPHLAPFYRRLGFQPYASPFYFPGLEYLGYQIPLRCMLVKKALRAA